MDLRRNLGIFFGALGAIVVAGVLEGLPGPVEQVHVALALVLVVMGAAALGGRLAGASTAVIATASFDFFFTEPVHSFAIDAGRDIITTILLLAVGIAAGELAMTAERRVNRERDERRELGRLQRVASLASQGADDQALIDAVGHELIESLGLSGYEYEDAAGATPALPRIERSGSLGSTTTYVHTGAGFSLAPGGVELPVQGDGRQIGRFVLHPLPNRAVPHQHRVVAVALSDQLGAVLAARHR